MTENAGDNLYKRCTRIWDASRHVNMLPLYRYIIHINIYTPYLYNIIIRYSPTLKVCRHTDVYLHSSNINYYCWLDDELIYVNNCSRPLDNAEKVRTPYEKI